MIQHPCLQLQVIILLLVALLQVTLDAQYKLLLQTILICIFQEIMFGELLLLRSKIILSISQLLPKELLEVILLQELLDHLFIVSFVQITLFLHQDRQFKRCITMLQVPRSLMCTTLTQYLLITEQLHVQLHHVQSGKKQLVQVLSQPLHIAHIFQWQTLEELGPCRLFPTDKWDLDPMMFAFGAQMEPKTLRERFKFGKKWTVQMHFPF